MGFELTRYQLYLLPKRLFVYLRVIHIPENGSNVERSFGSGSIVVFIT